MNATPPLLVRHHRRAVWTRTVWIFAAGLAVTLPLLVLGVPPASCLLALVPVAVLAVAARFWPRQTVRETARELDLRTGSSNRFETLVELGDRNDALATAAHAEIRTHVTQHPPPRPRIWYGGLAAVALLVGLNSVWFVSPAETSLPARPVVAAMGPAPAAPTPDAPPAALEPAGPPAVATLRWVTPQSTTTANPTEEIPAAAEAQSLTGLRNLTLHVSINGEPRPPIPLPDVLGAGARSVLTSLVLGPLEAKPYDIVAYHLSAERVRPANLAPGPAWAPVYSPLQFIEIRPPREESIGAPDSTQPDAAMLDAIQHWKREQFEVIRDGFALSHDLPARDDPAWAELMRGTESRQTASVRAADTALPGMASALPRDAVDRLNNALTEMKAAAQPLARSAPEPATAPASRAASHLVAAEAIAARFLWEKRLQAAELAAATPDTKATDLPERETTAIGRLEALSARQAAIADQLAARTPSPGIFAEHDALARAIAKLATDKAFPAENNDLVQTAAGAAGEAATQLNEQDQEAAAEPAARAAQALREALTALNDASRSRAAEQLLATQEALNRAAADLLAASDIEAAAREAALRTELISEDLDAGARREQQTGSADAARELKQQADEIRRSEIKQDLTQLAQAAQRPNTPRDAQNAQRNAAAQRLQSLAQRASSASNRNDPQKDSLEQTLNELRRLQANLDRQAGRDPAARGPLRWVQPKREEYAQPKETLALIAEAQSQTGFAQLKLQVRVNGETKPSIELPITVGPGRHSIPLALPLDDLKVKLKDTVTYALTGVPAAGENTATVSTPIQLIFVVDAAAATAAKNAQREQNQRPPSAGENNQQDEGINLEAIRETQRKIVERGQELENKMDAGGTPEAALQAAMKALEADQHGNAQEVDLALKKLAATSPRAGETFNPILQEMRAAEAAWKRGAARAATPPATRALVLLSAIRANATGRGPGGPEGATPGATNAETANSGNGIAQNGSNPAASYGDVVTITQRMNDLGISPQQANVQATPPIPGRGPTGNFPADYSTALSDRISGLIQVAEEAQRKAKRKETLVTANPAEAPPSYRTAVADYFEKLARERPSSPQPTP